MPRSLLLIGLLAMAGCGASDGDGLTDGYSISVTDHEDPLTSYAGDLLCWLELVSAPHDLSVDDLAVTASRPEGDTVTVLLEDDGGLFAVGERAAVREAGTNEFDERIIGRGVIIGLSIHWEEGLREVANDVWTPEN